jgi:hypothetical protein
MNKKFTFTQNLTDQRVGGTVMKIVTGGAITYIDPILIEEGCPKDNLTQALVWLATHYGSIIKQTKVSHLTFEVVDLEITT